jgi:Flp pilus assembly protein TadG
MRLLSKFLVRLWRCSSGSTLVEAAIIVPIAVSLMVGVVDFGWAFSTYATGSKSIRDAARYLGSLPTSIMTSGCPSWAVTNAQNLAVYGNIQGLGSALVPNWQVNGNSNNKVSVDCSNLPAIVVTGKIPYSPLMLAGFMPLASIVTLTVQHTEQSVGD